MASCGQQEFEIGTLNHFKIHSENLFERVSCDQLANKMFRRYGKDWFSDWLLKNTHNSLIIFEIQNRNNRQFLKLTV